MTYINIFLFLKHAQVAGGEMIQAGVSWADVP